MSPKMGARREEQFRRVMAERGVQLERPGVIFAFKWTKYRPDWYDPATCTYYEVIGTRQRGASIAATLDLMEIVHPSVEFRVVIPDGTRWMPKRYALHQRLRALPHGDAVLERARAEDLGVWDIAEEIGMTGSRLARVVDGLARPPEWLADCLLAFAQRAPIPQHPQMRARNRTGRMLHVCGQHCLDILELYASGLGTSRVSKVLGMHQATVYKILRRHRVRMAPVGAGSGSGRRYSEVITSAPRNKLADIAPKRVAVGT